MQTWIQYRHSSQAFATVQACSILKLYWTNTPVTSDAEYHKPQMQLTLSQPYTHIRWILYVCTLQKYTSQAIANILNAFARHDIADETLFTYLGEGPFPWTADECLSVCLCVWERGEVWGWDVQGQIDSTQIDKEWKMGMRCYQLWRERRGRECNNPM